MRERRFLLSSAEARSVEELLAAAIAPLAYRVTNLYLDDACGEFSRTDAGSPRFRVRLYEAEGARFGQIERKSVEDDGDRRKRVWPLAERLEELLPVLPALRTTTLAAPPDPYRCLLAREPSTEPLDLRGVTYLSSLTYDRVAFQSAEGRVTLDSAFAPPLIAPDGTRIETILEVKDTPPPELVSRGLRPLDQSKFALLMRSLRAA